MAKLLRGFFMDKTQLHNRLEQLHAELQQIECYDESQQRLLQMLLGDIKKLIEAGESDHHQVSDQLGEGLREGIGLFEASHPQATKLMGQVIDALSNMGI